MMLEGAQLTVHYPQAARAALVGASLAVDAGELVAVVGPNGSGKTTLLRALLGGVPLSGGRARIQGRDLGAWRPRELACIVAVVTQREHTPFPMRVSDTVMLGRYARLGPAASPGDEDRRAVGTAMERADVSLLAERRSDTLSGGEWQRVRIARALAQEPRALVLDEPTASLDLRHAMEIGELLKALSRTGLATLVATHDLDLAARYASRLVLMRAGEIVADGAPDVVLQPGLLEAVFEWPVTVESGGDGTLRVIPLSPGLRR